MGKRNLGSKSKRGLAWDLLGTFIRQLSSLAISVILARLLTPEEFGVVGMAMVFVAISQVFLDVGFTEGLVQRKEVSGSAYSSVFYINVGISLLLGVLIYFSAPLIGDFYENRQVTQVVQYLTLVLPIAAFGKVHAAQLTRKMDFKSLAARDIGGTVVGGGVGIVMALQGFGVYSLVGQQVVMALVATILLWWGTGWKPKRQFSFREVRQLLSFSSYVFFDRTAQTVFNKVDTLFVGKVFSASILGFYSRAESLNTLVNNYSTTSLGKVLFPVFSTLQDDKKEFESVFIKSISAVMIVTTALAGVLYFAADVIIIGLLGEKWAPSIGLFRILIFTTVALPLRSIVIKAMLGRGYGKLKFRLGIISQVLMLVSLPIGYFFGIYAFAWATVGAKFISVLLNWIYFNKKVDVSITEMLNEVIFPMLSLVALILVTQFLPDDIYQVVYALPFLIVHLTFLYLLKSQGMKLIIKEVRSLLVRFKIIDRNSK